MAVVYLAHDLQHDRQVALKVLRPELAATLVAERFLREVEFAAKLTHPHILPLYESDEANGLLFYTMPFLEGESLRDRLNRETQLPIEEALQITREVAEALSYAHTLGVVHRDIKPENILFEAGHALVADFGVAKAITEAGGPKLTETGMAVGTPAYMSPEQAAGVKEVDARADVYSLGCVLYEMLGGEPPYTGPTPAAVLARKVSEPVPPVRTVREAVPESLEQVLLTALARAPEERYATATELAKAVTGERLATAQVRATRRRRVKRVLRHPVTVAVVILLVVFGALRFIPGLANPLHRAAAAEPIRIMVRPFTYDGPPDQAFVAHGLEAEVREGLGGDTALRVIAPQTSAYYGRVDKTVRQIGEEIRVQYVLDGTVRDGELPDGSRRLQLLVEAVSAEDGAEVWSNTYTRDFATAALMDMQRALAFDVVRALQAELFGQEWYLLSGDLASPELPAVMELMRRAQFGRGTAEGERAALRAAEQMLALDSTSVMAWQFLAYVHFNLYSLFGDPTEARLAQARAALDRAVELGGEDYPTGQVHWLKGMMAYRFKDWDTALDHYEAAVALQPSNPYYLFQIALVQRRRGDWNDVIRRLKEAFDLNPRNAGSAFALAQTLCLMGRYEEGIQYHDSALALEPTHRGSNWEKAECLMWSSRKEDARRFLQSVEGVTEQPLWEAWSYLELCDRRYEAALERVPEKEAGSLTSTVGFTGQNRARIYTLLGRPALARAYWDSLLADTKHRFRDVPANDVGRLAWLQVDLGEAYAGLGRHQEALEAARRAQELVPMSLDQYQYTWVARDVARVYAMVGEHDAAVELLQYLISVPSPVHLGELRYHPMWDPLREHPGFQRLVGEE
jgi:serine/threonine-protein kinase